jgi:hypothetical protein
MCNGWLAVMTRSGHLDGDRHVHFVQTTANDCWRLWKLHMYKHTELASDASTFVLTYI